MEKIKIGRTVFVALIIALFCFGCTANHAKNGVEKAETQSHAARDSIQGQTDSHLTTETGKDQEIDFELDTISEDLKMAYDDRYSFQSSVKTITSLQIVSKKVGETELDDAVLEVDSNDNTKVIAVGCGIAQVELDDGSIVIVEVSSAPISLLLIAGQSNGEGRPSDLSELKTFQNQWVVNDEGRVYSTYGPSDAGEGGADTYEEVCWYEDTEGIGALSIHNTARFLPISLTDNTQNDKYNSTNKLTNAADAIGKSGPDSALGYEWGKLTGEKVWIINAAHHGSKVQSWEPDDEDKDNNFWEAVMLYQGAEQILGREIQAGHYALSHKGVFWCQGENNRGMGGAYEPAFKSVYQGFMRELDGTGIPEMEKELDFVGILMVRAANDPASEDDLFLTGPRRVQYYLSTNLDPECDHIYLASQAEEKWCTDAGVKEYFLNKYGTEDAYTSAMPLKCGNVSMPSTVDELHCNIHYTQLGYNEIGSDAADNICYALGYAEAPETQIQEIELVTEDGVRLQNGNTVTVTKDEPTKFAIRVYPTYLTKQAHIQIPDNVQYSGEGVEITEGNAGEIKVEKDSGYEVIEFQTE